MKRKSHETWVEVFWISKVKFGMLFELDPREESLGPRSRSRAAAAAAAAAADLHDVDDDDGGGGDGDDDKYNKIKSEQLAVLKTQLHIENSRIFPPVS